ncbi:MAG: lipoprotein signal peptidase [Bacteroidales bacterium]|nr:lipoprotein signal peptidase [Bacteroidales bacterium]
MALSRKTQIWILSVLTAVMLVFDQVVKVLVKTGMSIGQSIDVFGDWFKILFVENEGMAFGMAYGGDAGKYVLTSLRIVLVVLLFLYIRSLVRDPKKTPFGVLVGLTLVLVGALGNIVDCLFYGLIFEPSSMLHTASFVPFGQGYGKFMLGKVVDMIYCPLIDTTLPSWLPIWGGRHFVFFQPIFNVADSCITCGALYLLFFHWRYFSSTK